MSFLYEMVVQPLEFIIEFVFCLFNMKLRLGVVISICAVSLFVNFLALPLYNMADAIQSDERKKQLSMEKWIKHIKKSFHGDEQFMMLSAYYRQQQYHPVYALRSALSILIQIPFFMAAYNFLSDCSALSGKGLWFIRDLGAPDAVVTLGIFGGFTVNILPILMTLINIASSMVYTRGAPFKEKLQVYGLAAIFLVLLYNSPAGLVIYWILNNIFSLGKNIVLKMKHPGRICYLIICACFVYVARYTFLYLPDVRKGIKYLIYGAALTVIILPVAWKYLSKTVDIPVINGSTPVFLFSCATLWMLCGLLLPASVIASSPEEFSYLGTTESPMTYVWSDIWFFLGLFVVWPFAMYAMFGKKVQRVLTPLFFIMALCAVCNAFIFKYNYGAISVFFSINDTNKIRDYSLFFTVLPIVTGVVFFILYLFASRFQKGQVLATFMCAMSIGLFVVGLTKTNTIVSTYTGVKQKHEQQLFESAGGHIPVQIHLSKTENNVLVILLDRAVSSFVPYIFEQVPGMPQSFEGFIYYPNCVSIASGTNGSTPSLMGGYEYTVEAMNARNTELLRTKHDEAMQVMAKIFADAGYATALHNPPYIDYDSGMLPSSYDFTTVTYPAAANTTNYQIQHAADFGDSYPDAVCSKASKHFVLMEILYPPFRNVFSSGTKYLFERKNITVSDTFMKEFAELYYLPELTAVDVDTPTFNFFYNCTSHEYETLREGFIPGSIDEEHPAASTGSYQWVADSPVYYNDFQAYHSNGAALVQVQKYLEWMKEQGVYDNTRIIIVSDHGMPLPLQIFSEIDDPSRLAAFNSLMLVKDFDARGTVTTDTTFVTAAETVNFARQNLPVSEKNPFTGNRFMTASDFDEIIVHKDIAWQIAPQVNSTTYQYDGYDVWAVRDNVFEAGNWRSVSKEEVQR